MTQIPESAFPDPVVLDAAQAIAKDDFDDQLRAVAAERKLDYVGPEGDNLLLVAVMSNNSDAVQALLSLGANPDVPADRAPIAMAASGAKPEIVQAFIGARANVNGKAGSESALWRASLSNRPQVAGMLIENGADVDAANTDGDTPAIAAAQSGNFRMAMFLIERGADPFAVPKSGFTLGFWAERSRLPDAGAEGQAKNQLIQTLKDRGHPWPPLSGDEVLAAQAAGTWPPSPAP